MLKNYLVTAYRNLFRNKGFAFINIAGLAIGIAGTALILLWVEDEFSYNSHFKNLQNLYVVKDQQTYEGTTYVFDATPGPLAKAMTDEVPGIKTTARCTWGDQLLFSVNDKNIYSNGKYVDAGFLKMFELEFIKGNANQAFQQLHSLVLTEKTALSLFGSIDVTGKMVKVNNGQEYAVTGVVKNLPPNTSIRFAWLAPFENFENENTWLSQWGSNSIMTYAELDEKANVEAINKKLYGIVQSKSEGTNAHMFVYPMSRTRLYNNFDNNGQETEGRIKFVRLFTLIAWIILFIACINFMNLATARSEKRAREVGVRKTLGAGRKRLMIQFLAESFIMAVASGLLAILIVPLILPAFNSLVQKELALNIGNPLHFLSLFGITLLCGLLAGSYPAFYLSSFNPVSVLKGFKVHSHSSAGIIRKGLVVLQFSISVVLIICTLIIYKQISHVKSRDIGYEKEGLIYTYLKGDMVSNFNHIKNSLIATGDVQNACISSNHLLQLGSNTGDFSWQGKDPNRLVLITVENVSPEYISTTGVKLIQGRDFYTDPTTDSTNVIINESLAKLIGRKDIVGTKLQRDGDGTNGYTIVGVIKDFVYNSMYAPAQPMVMFKNASFTNVMNIRFKKGVDLKEAVAKVESVFKKEVPAYPFEYSFMDEQFDQLFKTEQLIGKLAAIFASLAIFISCMGLFGLAAYMAERRTKEISIRKILGATVTTITYLLSKDFLKLVLISCLISFPLSWWLMNNWLQSYEYHIEINLWVFALAGLSALLIALLTVSYQAIKAAIANPVNSLRTE